MPPTVLVTGGAGFIGSNFVRLLLRERPAWSVINLDALSYSGRRESLADIEANPRYRFVHGDICDAPLVARLLDECDSVVHLAAESHVDRSIADARPFIVTNILGTHVLLEALRRRSDSGKPARMVFAGTDEVYGSLPLEPRAPKFTEDSPLRPNNPYAASKTGADVLCRSYHETHGVDVVITRCTNNLGPYQFPEKIIPLFVTNLIEGRPVPLYGDGLHIRDWIHVDDHGAALLAALERGEPGAVYNIGAENERSNLELTREILRLMGKPESRIQRAPDRAAHDRRYALDASKIRRELGWKPTRSAWPAALEETVRWYQNNHAWWEPLKQRL